jgi:formiminoglutamase
MWQAADLTLWQGRIDTEEGDLAQRWHQQVQPLSAEPGRQTPGSVLLGFACDAGVLRNHGRPGAAAAPAAVRKVLANFAWHQPAPVYDGGEVHCQGDALEAAQFVLGTHVAAALAAEHRPLVIGGGHEVAWGSWQGLATWARTQAPQRIGVINFDAHFDLRAGESSTSGTPFRQIADDCRAHGQPFQYACFGVSRHANTAALFARAAELGVCWLADDQLTPWQLDSARGTLAAFLERVDTVHLSIDLDVLPAATAPGVSAPAARGVDLAVVETLVDQILASGKLLLAEIAELNPAFDIDHRTTRVAARLITRLAR